MTSQFSAPASCISYRVKGEIGFAILVTGCSIGIICVFLGKKSITDATSKLGNKAHQFLRDKEVSQLIRDKELLRLIRLFAAIAINLGAQVAPFWLAFCYPPFNLFVVASSSLLWKFTLGALPIVVTEKMIWLGHIVYVITLEPISQIGTAIVGLFLVLGHRVVWIVRIGSQLLTWCVVHVTQGNPFLFYQAKRATIRAIAMIGGLD